MSDFEVDMNTIARSVSPRRAPFLGTLCINPANCETCREYRTLQSSRRSNPINNELRRVTRIFVNAIDLAEASLGYPVRIFMLPTSAFNEIMQEFSFRKERQQDYNLVHPEHGHDVLISRNGDGLQTRYQTRISTRDTKILNQTVFDELMSGGKTCLYFLDTLPLYFDNEGLLRHDSPIVKLDSTETRIRILPPYDHTRQIHSAYGFHYMTLAQARAREEAEDRITTAIRPNTTIRSDPYDLRSYNDLQSAISQRTNVTVENTSNIPQTNRRRELMLSDIELDPQVSSDPSDFDDDDSMPF